MLPCIASGTVNEKPFWKVIWGLQFNMMDWADRGNLFIRHKHIKLLNKIKHFYYLILKPREQNLQDPEEKGIQKAGASYRRELRPIKGRERVGHKEIVTWAKCTEDFPSVSTGGKKRDMPKSWELRPGLCSGLDAQTHSPPVTHGAQTETWLYNRSGSSSCSTSL